MQPDRYCKDCGQELWPEDRFCTGCGRTLHAAAHTPVPEAEVPAPPQAPPPQANPAPAPTPEPAVPAPPPPPPSEGSPPTAGSEAPPTEETPLPPPTPAQARQPSEPRKASWKPVWGMLAVIFVLGFFATVEGLLAILAIVLFLGVVYYVPTRESGVTLRGAIFNWPLVGVAGFVTLLFIFL